MIRVDVVALVPTVYRQCASCEAVSGQAGISHAARQQSLSEYPSDVLDEYGRLSEWVKELAGQYGERIQIHLIDLQSGLGLWKRLRHRLRLYPAFIVNGRQTYSGWDRAALDALLQRALAAPNRMHGAGR